MKTPIKIGFYSHNIDYAGTWRGHENLLLALDPKRFDVYILYCPTEEHSRLDAMRTALGAHKLIPFERTHEKLDARTGYTPVKNNFHEVAVAQHFDIIHVTRSGYFEWPLTSQMAPLQVETNIFGGLDPSRFLNRSLAPNHWLNARRACDAVVYPPVPEAQRYGPSLRVALGIPADAIVCGRCGRPDNFDPIAIQAFLSVQATVPDLWYVNLGACAEFRRLAEGNPQVICLPPTSDDEVIARFFRTLDLFLHYRIDGEVQSLAISQAMTYALPVLSHFSTLEGGYNGQYETIGPGGTVANNLRDYTKCLFNLVFNPTFRYQTGVLALAQSRLYRPEPIALQMAGLYEQWLNS